ncbi:MAG: PepSY domain-containing protein [bacterium]|nr:hypothetical protein [Gammaproteobacteria bacterium]HIL95546.1 hypothetical protein [Pseudomonadales bacterium]
MLKESTVRSLRKGHRNVGIFLVLFLLLVSVTGILLNHTESLHLSERYVPAFVARRYYQSQEVHGFELNTRYYYTLGDLLYVDHQALTQCGEVKGVVEQAEQFVVLCDAELIVFTKDHQMIERFGEVHGLPPNLNRMAVDNKQLLLANDTEVFGFDTDTLESVLITTAFDDWPESGTVPAQLMLKDSVSWQQFLLDLHSGMFIGAAGKWLADLVAIFIVGVAISGLVMWRNPR